MGQVRCTVAVRIQGVVISWNDSRGYGFIQRDGGGTGAPALFVHRSSIRRSSPKVLLPGDSVWFEVVRGKKPGSMQADNVVVDHAWAFREDEDGDEPPGRNTDEDEEGDLFVSDDDEDEDGDGDEPLGGVDEGDFDDDERKLIAEEDFFERSDDE